MWETVGKGAEELWRDQQIACNMIDRQSMPIAKQSDVVDLLKQASL
jgi:hypothetical protein